MNDLKKAIQKAGPLRLGAVLLCGILLLVLSCGNSLWGRKTETGTDTSSVPQQTEKASLSEYKREMEQELVGLLKKVEGVGDVEVMLTFRASNEKVTLKDNTSRGDASEEETVLIEDGDRNSSPYVVQEREPELEGVVVVCDGGDRAEIKREITDAVGALFQLQSHKIKVMKSKEAKE